MSQEKTWLVVTTSGTPATGLVGTIAILSYTDRIGTPRTQPAITEIGGGKYAIVATDADVAAGVIALMDNGVNNLPRYSFVTMAALEAPLDAGLFVDNTGAPWTGSVPTFGLYKSFAGAALTPPGFGAVYGSAMYAWSPSGSDLLAGVTYRVDAPSGAYPRFYDGEFQVVIALPNFPVPPPVVSVVNSSRQSFGVQQDFGIDISTFPDLDPSFSLLQGNRVLAEALVRRWITVRGSMLDAPDYGCDIREYVNESGLQGNLAKSTLYRMKSAMENEGKKDQRCSNCIANLNYNQGTQTVSAQVEVDAAGGPFKLELAVTAVTVALLKLG